MSGDPMGPVQSTLELIVLRTLGAGSEMHGFAILEWIRASTDGAPIIEDGALYHALHRMQARGWVESSWGISEKGRRARYYKLGAEGRRVLVDEERRWSRYVEAVAKIRPHQAEA